ncbi:MAG: hypothetical protein E7Z64_03345 [Thermoplasmata archaeon]|nr:hypothetical protein [Thermoplasmata archaeon]
MITDAGLTGYQDPYIRDMSDRLAELILRRDYLIHHESLDLSTEYMMKVGSKELAVYRKQVEYRRLRRRLAKLRAYLNRGEIPDTRKVEEELDEEFREYERKIEEQTAEMRKLIYRLGGEELSPEESKELRDMYTKVVKRLHPDLNPGQDEDGLEAYRMAVEAYKNADLTTMRAIFWIVVDGKETEVPEKDLKQRIMEVEADIDRILRAFPFDKRDFLKDREAIIERNRELDYMMEDYEDQICIINGAIAKLGVDA